MSFRSVRAMKVPAPPRRKIVVMSLLLLRAPGYFEQARSAEDTLDKVSSADLRQAMTVLALASFFLADVPNIPEGHFTLAQTAAALIQGKQKATLEVLGLWPF